jgi:hypothetical protein
MLGSSLSIVLAAFSADYFVIAVFLLGFTLFLFLQARHFMRIEKSLADLSGGRALSDAIASLGEKVVLPDGKERIDLKEVESRLGELCLSSVRREERLVLLEEHLLQLNERLLEVVEAVGAIRTDPVREDGLRSVGLLDAIERRLFAKGFAAVTLIDEIEGKETGDHKIMVEVLKDNVPYKGHVTVSAGKVVDERLLPIYEAFP